MALENLSSQELKKQFKIPEFQEKLKGMPKIEMPEMKVPEISEEELKQLEEEMKKETQE